MTMAEDPPPMQVAEGSYIAQASGGSTATIIVYPSLPTPDSQNRKLMLASVRAFWIAGVLEPSLHEAAHIALGLSERSDIVIEPLRQDVQEATRPTRSLPPG